MITEVEGGGDLIKVGARYEFIFRCTNGLCRSELGLNPAAFRPAVQQYTSTRTSVVDGFEGTPCMPVTSKFSITRQADGSYRGFGSSKPRAVRASSGRQFCSWPSSGGTNVLTPILYPEPNPAAAAGPAALDPARITGYAGSSVVGGKRTPVTVTCDRGLCSLQCPLSGCSSTVFFTAADAAASSSPITLGSTCQAGRGSVSLSRDAAGGYLVRARATAPGAPAVCTSATEFRLTPVTR